MADFGGVMRFNYAGNALVMRGKFVLDPADGDYKAVHNDDGSFDRTVDPVGPSMEVEFVDSTGATANPQPWNVIMAGGPYNFTVTEDTNGILHTITNGKFIGRPKSDRHTGAVTGVTIQGPVGSYLATTTG